MRGAFNVVVSVISSVNYELCNDFKIDVIIEDDYIMMLLNEDVFYNELII